MVGFKMKQNCCLNFRWPSRHFVLVGSSAQLAESEAMRAGGAAGDLVALSEVSLHAEPLRMTAADFERNWLTMIMKEGWKGYTYNRAGIESYIGWARKKNGKKWIQDEKKRRLKDLDCSSCRCLPSFGKKLQRWWRTTTFESRQRRLSCDTPSYLPRS